jgi:primosomal protein N' (replication factor Y)
LTVIDVAVPLPLAGPFHYRLPPSMEDRVQIGHVVTVPFGNRRITGCVLEVLETAPDDRPLKDVVGFAIDEPLFRPEAVPFYRWLARYYGHPLGEVVRTALPAAARVATRKVHAITDLGRSVLASGETALDPQATALLETLVGSPTGSLTPNVLRKRAPHTLGALRRADRSGWVCARQEAPREVIKVVAEDVYGLNVDPRTARNAFPRLGPVRDRLIDWLHRFGPAPASEVRDAFPRSAAVLQQLRGKGLLDITQRAVDPRAAERAPIQREDVQPRAPTSAQATALAALRDALDAGGYHAFVLHGVTGSGKTEVYLQAAARALETGGSGILLVPEIGLTPQFLSRFRARFGDRTVAVLHSGLTDRDRFDEWLRIRRGEARLVVGPRSALFAPVENLRLLVVDEEHDGSYKQNEGLRYNARDAAMKLAHLHGAVVVLGSATPSLETVHLADSGRARTLVLPERVADRPMPAVELVDLREFPVEDPDAPSALLSPPLREAIEATIEAEGQTILLLNRRGFATTVLCTSCGAHHRCDDCDLAMTYHGRRHALLCHWCGAQRGVPKVCPACRVPDALKFVGRGTERLEDELLAPWPDLRVDRMDADTTRSRRSHRRILGRFRDRETDLLVGTQMVAKGHDFPGVTLVGVLQADAALHMPDFRASERTFQLIAQVAGRAGRGDRPGRVLVQTWHPEHHAIRSAVEHDWAGFVAREIRLRRGLWYPPFARLLLLRIECENEVATATAAKNVRRAVDEAGRRSATGPGVLRVFGPAPSPIYRAAKRYRRQVMVKADGHASMGAMLAALGDAHHRAAQSAGRGVRLIVDRDPVSLL